MSDLHPFVESLLSGRGALVAPWLESRREGAVEGPRSVPTAKDEEWRVSKPSRLTDETFGAAPIAHVDADALAALSLTESAGAQLVFVNGRYDASLSDVSALPDTVFAGPASQLSDAAQLGVVKDVLGQPVSYFDDVFTSLNDACMTDAAAIVVPRDTLVETPIQLLYIALPGDEAWATHPRTIVVVGRGSKANLVEEYRGPEGGAYLTNAVTELIVQESAKLEHVRVQRESDDAYHLSRHAVRLGRNAHYDSVSVAYGATWSRNDVYAQHEGEGTWCRIDGLTLIRDRQLADTHSVIDNRRAHCESHQLHKIIADDRAAGVFNGKIFVQKDAQRVDAYQLNRNLLLSNQARVNTKPQLEILADDVKCSHGATIGQLDDDQLFYLESRGFPPMKARGMLTYAFAAEVLANVHVASLRTVLEAEAASRVH